MSMNINGSRLRDARLYRQMSLTHLANMIGVSKQMVSKYERGKANPTFEIFMNILKALHFNSKFITGKDKISVQDEGTFFRSRLTTTQAEKAPTEMLKNATGVVCDLFSDYVQMPDLYINKVNSSLPSRAAIILRKQWNLGNKPIRNMLYLLEQNGIIVSSFNSDKTKVDANSGFVTVNNNKYYVVLSDENKSFYRQQFSLAHELGHFILHAEAYSPQELDPEDYRMMENEANEFASEFLMPADVMRIEMNSPKYRNDIYAYYYLKDKWKVSMAALMYRAKKLNIISPEDYVKLQKKMSYRKWRKNEPKDNSTAISKPQILRESLNLLEKANILHAYELSDNLDKKYGIGYPNEILSQSIGIPMNRFKNGQVISLRLRRKK